ncbi:hypothetical protein NVP1084O_193 [Vibrio phage 1.084.O._10N.261.49.F5]|nr:hypothetical protein NVP1084O_193 [Vibrio phage 1.084.O._10N.261.49.F5]
MWKEITSKEFCSIHAEVFATTNRVDVSEFCDFIEIEYVDTKTKDKVLKRTEQEMYDEVEHFPSIHRFFKWS